MPIKLLVIGGVGGGATAAARARRIDEQAEIILFERGEYISFANCGLPYYIGQVIKDRDDLLVTTAQALKDRYNIDVRVFSEVVAIDREHKRVTVRNLATDKVYTESYDRLILSPGAEPIKPPIDGIDLDTIFSLRNIPDSDRIKAFLDHRNPESAVVVGGGFIGLEMAENLVERGVSTTLIEKLDQVLVPLDYEMAAMVHDQLREKGVVLELENGAKSFSKKGKHTVISTEKGHDIECDLVILSIGVSPEKKLAQEAGLEIGELGGIAVDSAMRTSSPEIFAIGDVVEIRDFVSGKSIRMALAGPANKQGRIAADNALGRKSIFNGAQGTAIVKIFDLSAASTGASEKILKQNQTPHLVSHTHSDSHATYYPGAELVSIKLIFTPGDGKLLGAQVVGRSGVDKRIDVLATAIRAGMTVFGLEALELAYAPPFSSAKDPVNIAGFVAANMIKGDLEIANWNELESQDSNHDVLIDVRDKSELDEYGTIEGALHIPVNELRQALSLLDERKRYVVFCAVGMRAYVAHRILVQNGFKSHSLNGGFTTTINQNPGARLHIQQKSS